jgi:hypothetical protein|tara:strand:- start:56 stop:1189 length:1134 start_codon:yes stop_codon:yes gene_type:complete
MADTFYFSRDTKVHLTDSASAVYNIPVLDGFSFSQATNTTEVTLNEMTTAAGVSRRARQMFTDSYAPAEWSFSTYIRPFATGGAGSGGEHASDGNGHMVEEALWNALAGNAAIGTSVSGNTGPGFTSGGSAAGTIAFGTSNSATLDTFTLHFEMGSGKATPVIYKIANCVVNEVTVDYDIDGIATAQWTGMGSLISEEAMSTATIYEGTAAADTNNFIRNRLTDLAVTATATGNIVTSYPLTLTGGSFTISNNLTFLTPETLGIVNQPLGHVTGTRSVSGSFTCYLNTPASGASSTDLFEDLISSTDTITNDFNLVFVIGGTGGSPRLTVTMPTCHLEVPTHSIDDLVSLETTFHALPTSVDGTDEITLVSFGPDVT